MRGGILLVNLGTPSAPTAAAVRRYLAEFLSDPRVVELPRWLWLPILYGVVLPTRSGRSAAKYAKIWTAEGSPLAVHTARQAALLGADHAMRYGEPGIASVLQRIRRPRVVVPLYPQYSRSTTESVRDVLPADLRMIQSFHDHPRYIAALAARLQAHWHSHGRADKLVMSFHGLPQRAVDRGDPYARQCRESAALLAAKTGLRESEYVVTFQSRFGAAKWLQPYTEPTLVSLANAGATRLDVICPGFVSDCLETLEEIDIAARTAFLAAGGKDFRYVACLNEAPEWISALEEIAGD